MEEMKLSVDRRPKKEKSMKKLAMVLFAVLFVMGLAVNSDAAAKESGGMHGGMSKHDKGCGCAGSYSPMSMFKKLGLDEKQKEAVRAIHLQTKKTMIKKAADIKVAKIELQEILSKDPVDLAAAEAAVKKIENQRTEMKMMRIKAMEEVKSNLNPEQRKKFSEMMSFLSMKRHGRHGECRMHGEMGTMKEKGGAEHKHR